jgi:nitrite reductase (NADH) large subunit
MEIFDGEDGRPQAARIEEPESGSETETAAEAPVALVKDDDGERTICFCHNVCAREILEAIARGADSVAAIQAETLASTGCGGCEMDVCELLDGARACAKKNSEAK